MMINFIDILSAPSIQVYFGESDTGDKKLKLLGKNLLLPSR